MSSDIEEVAVKQPQTRPRLFHFLNPLKTTPQPENAVLEEGSFLSPTPKEIQLLTSEIVGNDRLNGGTNETRLVRFRENGLAVFKPGDGERLLEIPESHGRLYKRERAAYLVDRALNLGLIPTTVIRSIDGREGSLQEFIPDAANLWEISDTEELEDQFYTSSYFDYSIWNKDRKDEHLLVTPERNMKGIDNGLSFDEWWEYLISDNLESYVYGRPAPSRLKANVSGFLDSSSQQKTLQGKLSELIPTKTVDATFARIKYTDHLFSTKGRIESDDGLVYFPS